MKTIEEYIAEAASDYKMGMENDGFAEQFGGIDALRDELFSLVVEWEREFSEGEE